MKKYLNLAVVLISVSTLIAGFVQMICPSLVLGFVGAQITPASSHFFAIVGMFMALFGGLMLHAVYSAASAPVAVLWCALQKLGAAAAVSLGIANGIFSAAAAGVAAFDLLSGILFLYYLKAVRSE